MASHYNMFSEEQIRILRSNPYIRKVNDEQVSFTVEFKDEFWRLYTEEDMAPYDILGQLGVDYHILGSSRVQGLVHSLKRERSRYGNFSDKHTTNRRGQHQPRQEAGQQQAEVEYLRQELEFLKKIILAGKDGKQKC